MAHSGNGNGLDNLVLLSGNGNPKLAADVGKILGQKVTNPITYFSDGEIRVKGIPNLRRRSVFIIQPTPPPVNDRLMELVLMIDASRRASAKEITAVVPYFGYSRQDRKEQPRVPISAAVAANMLRAAGIDRIMTVDIHAEQLQGFVQYPWDNTYASYALIPAFQKKKLKNLVVSSPDKGGVPRATGYAGLLGVRDLAIVYKQRDISVENKSETYAMIGEVKGKNVLLVDDMLDSGGTMFNAARHIAENGAKDIYVIVSHGLFTGSSLEDLSNSPIKEVLTTDSIAHRKEVLEHPKIKVVSIAPMIAEAILREQTGQSISELILDYKK